MKIMWYGRLIYSTFRHLSGNKFLLSSNFEYKLERNTTNNCEKKNSFYSTTKYIFNIIKFNISYKKIDVKLYAVIFL